MKARCGDVESKLPAKGKPKRKPKTGGKNPADLELNLGSAAGAGYDDPQKTRPYVSGPLRVKEQI